MRTSWARQVAAGPVGLALVVALATGCGAPSAPSVEPSAATPTPSAPVVAPADGVSLAVLGFANGPTARVFLPRTALLTARVDQPDNVTLVLSSPAAGELLTYLRGTLSANGFTVTADDSAARTLTFAGFGWNGTFTGDTQASALLLRPAR